MEQVTDGTLAGLLMVVLAVVQVAAMVLGQLVRGSLAEGPPLSAMLGSSSGVVGWSAPCSSIAPRPGPRSPETWSTRG